MRILKATRKDVSQLVNIEQSCLKHYHSKEHSIGSFKRSVSKDWMECYVAKDNKTILGFIALTFDMGAWIEMLAIKKEHRRKCIGKLLIQKAIEISTIKKYNHIDVGSYLKYNATGFYLKAGFEILEEGNDGFNDYRDFRFKIIENNS